MMRPLQFASLVLLAGSLSAADVSGIWTGKIPVGRQGALLDIAFKLTQDGNVIGGKLYGDYKSFAITEGSIQGDTINFSVIVQEQAGNEINNTLHKFTGTITDGKMELTRERGTATSAGNGGGYQFRRNDPVKFTLNRLL